MRIVDIQEKTESIASEIRMLLLTSARWTSPLLPPKPMFNGMAIRSSVMDLIRTARMTFPWDTFSPPEGKTGIAYTLENWNRYANDVKIH
ncbi:MAG: hypothetical protein Q8K00_21210 [Syntrophales bacterium]|nr:hypothetical protein [Syntrophales bacterium]